MGIPPPGFSTASFCAGFVLAAVAPTVFAHGSVETAASEPASATGAASTGGVAESRGVVFAASAATLTVTGSGVFTRGRATDGDAHHDEGERQERNDGLREHAIGH